MEQFKALLFRLLKDELDSQMIGRPYDKDRLRLMRNICHIIKYHEYGGLTKQELKILKDLYKVLDK